MVEVYFIKVSFMFKVMIVQFRIMAAVKKVHSFLAPCCMLIFIVTEFGTDWFIFVDARE